MDESRAAMLAERMLGQVLGVRTGENVCIVRDSELSESLGAAFVRRAIEIGAKPVSLVIMPRSLSSEELLPPVEGAILQSDVVVCLTRVALVHARGATAALKAGVRFGNLKTPDEGLLDSPGMDVDYELVRSNALAVDALLEKARVVRVTTAEGTDLTMQLGGRKGFAQTGFGTEPGSIGGLPDGESTVAPLEGTTQGRLVNPYILDKIGVVSEPFQLNVKDGWIVSVEGGKEAQQLNDLFDKSDANARRFASQFAMGMNPGCRVVPLTREVSKRLGTIHVAFGDNISLGGTVQSDIHIDIVLLDPVITLDDRVLLEGGNLQL